MKYIYNILSFESFYKSSFFFRSKIVCIVNVKADSTIYVLLCWNVLIHFVKKKKKNEIKNGKNVWQDELIHSESLQLENKQVGMCQVDKPSSA